MHMEVKYLLSINEEADETSFSSLFINVCYFQLFKLHIQCCFLFNIEDGLSRKRKKQNDIQTTSFHFNT